MTTRTITKVLAANDTGETGAHQAGLLIPREKHVLAFFPPLDPRIKNPRAHLLFKDPTGVDWEFAFIYYNNKLFGGTRNEYRLTRMTKFIREAGLAAGDEVQMVQDSAGQYSISYRRENEPVARSCGAGHTVLRLGSGWKVIDLLTT